MCLLQYLHVQHLTGAALSAKRQVCKILNTHDFHCTPNLTLQDDRSFLQKIRLLTFKLFSFARNKRGKMNVQETCSIQFFDLMLCLFFKLRCGFSDRLRGLLLPSALVQDDVLLIVCYPAGAVHQNDAFYITSFLTCYKMYLFYIFCISILHVF